MNNEHKKQCTHTGGHKIFAFILIILGSILLLDQLNIISDFSFRDLLPVLLLIPGFYMLFSKHGDIFRYGIGILLSGGGIVLLLRNFEIIPHFNLNWSLIWPVLIIIFGLRLLLRNTHASVKDSGSGVPGVNSGDVDTDVISLNAFLGGSDFNYTSKNLKGGNLTAVMGGAKVVLTSADMDGDTMVLNCFAFWGGIEIYIPSNWKINVKCVPIMGAVEHSVISEQNGSEKNKTLIIEGSVIMGGVEIKS